MELIQIKNTERVEKKKELNEEYNFVKKEIDDLVSRFSEQILLRDKSFQTLVEYYNDVNFNLCRYDLQRFIEQSWKIVTGTEYVHYWYIDAICDHMELLYDLEFQKLIMSLSPRSGKSTILSQIYPVWLWLQDPRNKILTVSYRRDLSMRDARASRDLINHNWFQTNWGEMFQWSKDQNAKSYYENGEGGNRMGLSVGAAATGFGYHYICMDDINAASDANSPAKLRAAVEYYEGTLRTRWQNPQSFRQVCLQQRISIDDLSGYLQKEYSDWVVLKLPEEYTGMKAIGFRGEDARNTIGELLKPKLFSAEFVEKEKQNIFKWQSQFQQNPVPPGGAYVKREDLRYWANEGLAMRPSLEDFDCIFMSIDLSDGSIDMGSSYTCLIVVGTTGARFYVLDIAMERITFPEQLQLFLKFNQKYNPSFALIEELSNGRALCDYLEREYKVNNLVRIQPKEYGGDKFTRFSTILPRFACGHIWLPASTVHPLSKTVAEQLLTFPKGSNDDFVDALSQAVNYVQNHNIVKGGGKKEYAISMDSDTNEPKLFETIGLTDIGYGGLSLGEVRGLF